MKKGEKQGFWGEKQQRCALVRSTVTFLAHTYTSNFTFSFCRRSAPPFSLSFPTCGEGFGKGNLVSLSSVAEVWNPLRNGFQVFVTF